MRAPHTPSSAKRAARARAGTGEGRKEASHQKTNRIIGRRDELMAEIAAVSQSRARPFLEKAHTLLTRAWSRADWRMREQLLKTAAWLINLHAQETRLAAPSAVPAEHPARPRSPEAPEFTSAGS